MLAVPSPVSPETQILYWPACYIIYTYIIPDSWSALSLNISVFKLFLIALKAIGDFIPSGIMRDLQYV